MKQPAVSKGSRWKALGVSLLVGFTPASAIVAFAEPADADALRQQAVAQYVDGATRELDAYRQQIGAAAHSANQEQLADAKAKLDECDRLVAGLKSADPEQFDRIKATYERTRGEMVKSLQAAQKT